MSHSLSEINLFVNVQFQYRLFNLSTFCILTTFNVMDTYPVHEKNIQLMQYVIHVTATDHQPQTAEYQLAISYQDANLYKLC